MPTSNSFPLSCIRAALTLRRVSLRQIAGKHGASYHSCYAMLAGTRPGRAREVRRAVREIFVIARRVLGPTHEAILVLKNSLHATAHPATTRAKRPLRTARGAGARRPTPNPATLARRSTLCAPARASLRRQSGIAGRR